MPTDRIAPQGRRLTAAINSTADASGGERLRTTGRRDDLNDPAKFSNPDRPEPLLRLADLSRQAPIPQLFGS
jgi:hypothetical protein